MLPIDLVCVTLLIIASHLHVEAVGQIQTYFGRCVNVSAIPTINSIEVSAFSRLKSFVQCASYFKSKHLVFFDGRIERAYDRRHQQQDEDYRMKCAPVTGRPVIDSNVPKLRERRQQGNGDEKVRDKWCQAQKQKLNPEEYSAHEVPPKEKEIDVFVRSRYVVVTLTGLEEGGDSKFGVYLDLTGEVASHRLFLKNSGNELQLGQNDTFQFSSPCSIGEITRMHLSLPSLVSIFGAIDRWACVQIDLRRELEYTRHLDVEVFHSNVSRWLPRVSVLNLVGSSHEEITFTRLERYRKDF